MLEKTIEKIPGEILVGNPGDIFKEITEVILNFSLKIVLRFYF